MFKKIRAGLAFFKGRREGKRIMKRAAEVARLEKIMSEQSLESLEQTPRPIAKSIGMSNTTKDVAKGAAASSVAGGGTAYGAIKAVRALKPDLLPWGEDMDGNVALVTAIVLVPLFSRLSAYLRRGPATT